MRTFLENFIHQIGKIQSGNVMNILTELKKIVSFVKTADVDLHQMAPSAFLQSLSLLQHALGPSSTRGTAKADAGHTHASVPHGKSL